MTFSHLAQYFEKLEKTSSRLELISILSQLFKEIDSSDEIERVIYLVQGRIAPFYEALEIGMAEKTVAEAIARAYNANREEVLREFDRLGDMGKTAQQVAQGSKIKDSIRQAQDRKGLKIDEVFGVLTEIANTSGDGTVGKRVTLLSDLLKKVDSNSAKH